MDNAFLKDVLKVYFGRIFPFDDFYKWLSYGNEKTFAYREFALNFDGERFLRNQAYSHIHGLKHEVKKLCPVKIDIGAVYNALPLNKEAEQIYYPIQKELMFDIDITDYDEVRSCCSGTDICAKCWKYMVIAIKILDEALRDDFGFSHILWTFSGRRGVHGWVCDKKARFLKKDARFAIGSYLQLIIGGDYKKKKVEITNKVHHSITRALKVIEPLFLKLCIEEQNMLGTEKQVLKFLEILPEDEMRNEVKDILDQHPTSLAKWEAFVNFFKLQIKMESDQWCKIPFFIEEIMIQYAYPRLDIHVTTELSHLLKSPFCVHPKTGKIGIPIDPKTIDEFDLKNVPTILELMDQIDVYDAKMINQGMSQTELKKISDIKKTSLNKYLLIFQQFLYSLEKDE